MLAWQVHNLLALYDEVEVPRDRLLFKIPATWQVCLILNGIHKYIFVVHKWCRDSFTSEGYAFWWQFLQEGCCRVSRQQGNWKLKAYRYT